MKIFNHRLIEQGGVQHVFNKCLSYKIGTFYIKASKLTYLNVKRTYEYIYKHRYNKLIVPMYICSANLVKLTMFLVSLH